MINNIFIETERLIVKILEPSDFPELAKLQKDPDSMHFLGGPRTDEKIAEVNNLVYEHLCRYGFSAGLVYEKSSGNCIGRAGIIHLDFEDVPEVELACFLLKNYWRKGYATELSHAFLDYAFNHIKTPSVYCTVDPDNIASYTLVEKFDFTFEKTAMYQTLNKLVKFYVLHRSDFLARQ